MPNATARLCLLPNPGGIISPGGRTTVSGDTREEVAVVTGDKFRLVTPDGRTNCILSRPGVRTVLPVPKFSGLKCMVELDSELFNTIVFCQEIDRV